jgi:hypothetical protein
MCPYTNYKVHQPDSILVRIDRAHFKKVSSTFSPVRALVSRNISSVGGKKE